MGKWQTLFIREQTRSSFKVNTHWNRHSCINYANMNICRRALLGSNVPREAACVPHKQCWIKACCQLCGADVLCAAETMGLSWSGCWWSRVFFGFTSAQILILLQSNNDTLQWQASALVFPCSIIRHTSRLAGWLLKGKYHCIKGEDVWFVWHSHFHSPLLTSFLTCCVALSFPLCAIKAHTHPSPCPFLSSDCGTVLNLS